MSEKANLNVFRTFVWFALVWFCLFSLPLGVCEGRPFVIVPLLWLFSYLFLWVFVFSCNVSLMRLRILCGPNTYFELGQNWRRVCNSIKLVYVPQILFCWLVQGSFSVAFRFCLNVNYSKCTSLCFVIVDNYIYIFTNIVSFKLIVDIFYKRKSNFVYKFNPFMPSVSWKMPFIDI